MQPYHIAVTVIRGDKSARTHSKGVVKVSAVEGYGVAVDGLPGGRRYITGNRVNVPTVAYGDVLNITGNASRPVQVQVKSAPYIAPHGTTGPFGQQTVSPSLSTRTAPIPSPVPSEVLRCLCGGLPLCYNPQVPRLSLHLRRVSVAMKRPFLRQHERVNTSSPANYR